MTHPPRRRCTRRSRNKLHLEPHQIILRPLVTEKGMHRSTRYNAYAFEVNRLADKDDVRRAVEELFDVKVIARATRRTARASRAARRSATAAPRTGRRPS